MHKITTKTTKIRYTFLQSIVSEMIYEPFSVVTCACNENIHSIVYRAGHPHSRFVLYLSQHKRIAVHLRISWTPHKPSTVKNEQKIKISSKHTRIGVYVSPCFFFFFFRTIMKICFVDFVYVSVSFFIEAHGDFLLLSCNYFER